MSKPQESSETPGLSSAQSSRALTALQVMSDLHLETPMLLPMYPDFSISPKAKHLALLGDIGLATDERLFEFLTRQLRQFETVFYVLGNHEPYGTTYENAVNELVAFESRVTSSNTTTGLGKFVFLNQTRYDLCPQTTILGCTLFSRISEDQQSTVSLFVSDFANITDWTIDAHNAHHQADLTWLNEQVEILARTEPHRRVVILTHYSPTMAEEANDPEHLEDVRGVQTAFVTDLREEVCWTSPSVQGWAFGHTHWNCDFVDAETGKRVVANQRGYGREDAFDFDGEKVVCIG